MSNLVESLKWRYACKEFDSSKEIPKDEFNQILEGLVLTASSYGAQPWEFVVVKNKDLREKLVGASYSQAQVKDASHLIVMCRPSVIDEAFLDGYIANICQVRGQEPAELAGMKAMIMHTINKTDAQKASWAKNQIYIALGNLLTICADMKIDTCPMEGFVPSKVDEILGLESMGLKSVVLCPLGYRSIEDKYSGLKKVRHELEKVVKIIE
jgi:nitroreductase/dihydropteridine reductase